MLPRSHAPLAALALLALLLPAAVDAQVRRGRATQEEVGPWTPIAVGVHGGYDDASRGELIGIHARVPILRNGRIQFMPSADVTFLNGGKDYQYVADVVFVTQGRSGGLYVGGGIGRRSSLIDSTPQNPGRNTFTTYDVTAGFLSGIGVIQTALQVRWIFPQEVMADFRPISFTLGISFPLWGRPNGS